MLIGRARCSDDAGASPALDWAAYEWLPGAVPSARRISRVEDSEGGVLLLELGDDEVMMIAGAAIRRLPAGPDRGDLLRRASIGAAGWERERSRLWRWLRLPEQLQAFAEHLNEADSTDEVTRVLRQGIVDVVGAYDAHVLLRADEESSLYSAEARLVASGGAFPLTVPSHPRLWHAGIVVAAEAGSDRGSPFSHLGRLFADSAAASVAHVPLGRCGVVLVVERRNDRIFEPEDWTLLRSLASQADGALRRVRSLQEVRTLSLTDPLTGLANRRRMQVVMEHAWAAALRGKPLSVALIDLDHFKQVNDRQGHLAGDRMLQQLSEVLSEEARGSDLVVRYGGDEFLVVMPGETSAGAAALVSRVQTRLGATIAFSAGIAEHGQEMDSPEELIAAADRHLYEVKQRLRWVPV